MGLEKGELFNLFVCACVNLCASHIWRYLQRPEKGVRSPGTVVTGGFEVLNVGARSRTGVFCKYSKCSNH